MIALDYLLRLLINLLVMVPCLACGNVVGLVNREAGVSVLFWWVRFFLRLFGVAVTVRNENDSGEPLTGCIFTLLDQTSLLDGPVGVTVIPRPCKGVVNLEYALIPIFGWSMWVFCWVIIRQWPAQARKSLSKAESFLQDGGNLWMSIEGKRSKDGSISPFKKGPVVLAIRAQAKIVPIIITGTHESLGYGKWRIQPGRVVVRLLKAIPTSGLTYNDRNRLVDQLAAIAERETAASSNQSS